MIVNECMVTALVVQLQLIFTGTICVISPSTINTSTAFRVVFVLVVMVGSTLIQHGQDT